MKTNELIAAALTTTINGVTLYWDKQDPNNEGPAYRILLTDEDGNEPKVESGALELLRWEGNATGMHLEDFFRGPDGAYLGPDQDGVYPVLIAA